jgi:SnoaL-like domain
MSDRSGDSLRLSAEDRLEILELLARYCWAIDCDDGPAWASTFIPDGVFHSLLLDRSFSGYDELVGMIDTLKQRRIEGYDRNLIHVPANVVLEPREDGKVRLVAQLLGPRRDGDGSANFAIGWYDDVVVRTEDGWRFEVRHHKHWPDPDLGGSPVG